jgi:hypothetical protein
MRRNKGFSTVPDILRGGFQYDAFEHHIHCRLPGTIARLRHMVRKVLVAHQFQIEFSLSDKKTFCSIRVPQKSLFAATASFDIGLFVAQSRHYDNV